MKQKVEFNKGWGLLLIYLVAGGAWAAVPRVKSKQAAQAASRWPGVTLAQLEEGRTLYIAKCAGCHVLRLPDSQPANRWPFILDRMQMKSGISQEQKTRILQYILTVRLPDTP